jgi:ABC-type nitrate/sulfonate/bicarbonate transport system permease component
VSKRSRARLGGVLLGTLGFAAALALWEVWARSAASFSFPPPSDVASRAWHVWPSPEFRHAVDGSLARLAVGFAVGAAAAVAIGLVMGASPSARRLFLPAIEFLRALPPIALVPIFVVLLGVGDSMRTAVIALGVFFPVLLATVDGVRAAPPELRDNARLLHVGRVEALFRIYLPAALPSIFAGLRTALSLGLVLVVISEVTGEGDGLGVYIRSQQALFNVRELYGALLFLGLLGYVLNRLFLLVERRALAWHYGAIGEQPR